MHDFTALIQSLSHNGNMGAVRLLDSDGQLMAVLPFVYPLETLLEDNVCIIRPPPGVMLLSVSSVAASAVLTDSDGGVLVQAEIPALMMYRGGRIVISDLSVDENGLNISVRYDVDVRRPESFSLCSDYAQAVQAAAKTDVAFQQSQSVQPEWVERIERGAATRGGSVLAYHQSEKRQNQIVTGYYHAIPVAMKSWVPFEQNHKVEEQVQTGYQQAISFSHGICSHFDRGLMLFPLTVAVRFDRAICLEVAQDAMIGRAVPLKARNCLTYQHAALPRYGTATLPEKPPESEEIPEAPIIKIYKTVWIVNEFELIDIDSGKPIPCLSASIATDKSSYAWQFSLSLPHTAVSYISRLKEWEVRINGHKWRMLVTDWNKVNKFGETVIQVRGFSPTVLLAAPYALTRSMSLHDAMPAKALAEAELERTDFISGFTLDWKLTDPLLWPLYPNLLAYQDKTPIQVLKIFADAGGGWLYSHMNRREISVQPQYPKPFWQWKTPDMRIADSLILQQDSQTAETPLYDGVYVSGTEQGITALVRRTGTAGANQATMVSDPLITDEAVARQRGLSVLGSGGRVMTTSLTVPLHEDIGIVLPNTLVGVSDWLGLSTQTAISISWQNGLQIRQKISIERHLDDF